MSIWAWRFYAHRLKTLGLYVSFPAFMALAVMHSIWYDKTAQMSK